MRMTSLAAAVATIVVSTVAAADPQACITQSEQAQQARTHGRRIAARELYHACSLAECPTAIRSRRSTGGRSRSIAGGTACTSSARAARVDDQEIVAHEAGEESRHHVRSRAARDSRFARAEAGRAPSPCGPVDRDRPRSRVRRRRWRASRARASTCASDLSHGPARARRQPPRRSQLSGGGSVTSPTGAAYESRLPTPSPCLRAFSRT